MVDEIKKKQKAIKMMSIGLAGTVSMKVIPFVESSLALINIKNFATLSSFSFLGILAIPNYIVGMFGVSGVLLVYLAYVTAKNKEVKKG